MNTSSQTMSTELLDVIKRNAGVAIAMGVVLVIVGLLALGAPLVAGLSVAMIVGALLLAGGIAQLFMAFKAGSFGRGLMIFLMGALTVVVGAYMISNPGIALATLTLFLAAWFVVEGIFEILWAFQLKPIKGWGWTLFSGLVSLLLGIMIWRQFPVSGAWAIGILAGIKLIFSGLWLIILGSAGRSAAKEVQEATP